MISSRRFKPIGDYRGTVQIPKKFDPESDAQRLCESIRYNATDLIELVTSRSMAQRMEIASIYESTNDSILSGDIKRKIKSKKFREALVTLLQPPEETDARNIYKALRNQNDHVKIVEILKTREPREIHFIKVLYEDVYDISLEDDMSAHIDGNLLELYTKILKNEVYIRPNVPDTTRVLHNALENLSREEASFIVSDIFAKTSLDDLKTVFEEYLKNWKDGISMSLLKTFEDSFCESLTTIVDMARNLSLHYARRLNARVKKSAIDHDQLTWLIVSRSEIDMQDIKIAFWEEYDMTLESLVEKTTKRKLRKTLLSLIQL